METENKKQMHETHKCLSFLCIQLSAKTVTEQ